MVKETLCSKCVHLEVCSFKNTYLKATEAVNQSFFTDTNDQNRITYVANLRDWLTIPDLICVYFMGKSEYILSVSEGKLTL